MIRLILVILVSLTACGPATTGSNPKDLATDLGTLPDAYLYYVEGSAVVQAKCPATGARTRDRCTLGSRRVPAKDFVAEMNQLPRLDADSRAASVGDARARFDQVQLRLAEILNGTPETDDSRLIWAQILTQNQKVASLEAQLTELEGQIARARDRLARGEGPADLAFQLARMEGEANDLRSQVAAERSRLKDLERSYVAARGTGRTDRDYRDLLTWQESLVVQWNEAEAAYQAALDERVELARLLRYLEDGALPYPVEIMRASSAFESLKVFAGEFDGVFERVAVARGEGVAASWFAAVRRGHYDSTEPPRALSVVGWSKAGGLSVQVSGLPALRRHCLSSSGQDDPDMTERSDDLETAGCSLAASKPWGPDKWCYSTHFYEDAPANRKLRLDVTLAFLSPTEISYEVQGRCYSLDGEHWYYGRTEVANVKFRPGAH